MALDGVLMVLALCAYAIGAVVLLAFFFTREEWLRNLGATLAVAGCVAQFAQLGARYDETHIWPLLNLYGSLSLFAAMSVAIFIGFAFRYRLWFAGGLLLALAAIFLAYGTTWNEGVMPAVPSLQSYWAKVHVPLVVSSYGAFAVSLIFSIVYLVKYYGERRYATRRVTLRAVASTAGAPSVTSFATLEVSAAAATDAAPTTLRDTPALATAAAAGDAVAGWFATLPSLAQIDIVVYRAISIGLPLLTLGVITGAAWAHEAWGAYWQWDPKETAALASWILYAAYMHLHTRASWRGMRCSWWSVVAFASIVFCYLGVNIWISGLHSYKM
ncbi:MAG: c-type cytochrome biogenesis protein CcsB [Candidatus Tyrphobacter sp.]